jgi:hypothetical protein
LIGTGQVSRRVTTPHGKVVAPVEDGICAFVGEHTHRLHSSVIVVKE